MKAMELEKNLINEIKNLPIDILEEINSFIKFIKNKKIDNDPLKLYLQSKQFEENKKILEQTYQDVIDEKANLLSHEEVWEKIDLHIQSREYEN